MLGIGRREVITLLGVAAAWPLVARAQQPTKPTISWLDLRPGVLPGHWIEPFRRGMAEFGFLEGRDVTVEYQTADGHYERLPALIDDLVLRRAAVIFTPQGDTALAVKAATRTIPVVFLMGGDPVELGLVASLNRPAGNLTGVAVLSAEIAAKRLELLHKLVPTTESIAMLAGRPDSLFSQDETRRVQSAARILGLRSLIFNVTTDSELSAAFATLVDRRAGAVLIGGGVQLVPRTDQIVSLAVRYALPTMFVRGDAVRAGGLSSYGPVLSENLRLAGTYTGRILKGEKPADLPVQLATRFELNINLNAAKALGLVVPPTLLALADEVIE
jgi:ABC-type uncharacterized transport system substrate-binding protein